MPPSPVVARSAQPVPSYPVGLQPGQRSYQAASPGAAEVSQPVSVGAELALVWVQARWKPGRGPLPRPERGPEPQPGELGARELPVRPEVPEPEKPEPG